MEELLGYGRTTQRCFCERWTVELLNLCMFHCPSIEYKFSIISPLYKIIIYHIFSTSLSANETLNSFVSILLDKAAIFSMPMKFPSASLFVRRFIVTIIYIDLQDSFCYLPLENWEVSTWYLGFIPSHHRLLFMHCIDEVSINCFLHLKSYKDTKTTCTNKTCILSLHNCSKLD